MTTIKGFARWGGWLLMTTALAACLGSLHVLTRELDHLGRTIQLDATPEASLVYDRNGTLVFSFATEDRTTVPLSRVSEAMVAAVLASEDRHFFQHAGMDVIGLARAAWVDFKARAARQGGSTITQQLVRSIALTADKNLARKIKEALLALRVERRFEKQQILEAYLNRIYFGSGHYGVQAAARGYFGKSAADLTIAESALLAGLIPCPSACSPRVSPDAAQSRRDAALNAMLEHGSITDEQYADALESHVALVPERHDPYTSVHEGLASHDADAATGLYFLEAVRQQVMRQFGAENVLEGGLRIYTTLDTTLQRHAEDVMRARLAQLDKTGRLEGALVAIDPATGEVLAMVGGRDFHRSPFNRAMQARRQPGSAFKPLVFAAALEQGYTPSFALSGIDRPVDTPQGLWLPSGEHEAGTYTLRQALTVSSNRAAVRVMQMVGIGTAQSYARRLGISDPLPAVPSLALGTGEVTLVDLTSAYGAFANGGIVAPHTLITRIEDRSGEIVWEHAAETRPYRAVRAGTAYLMSSMMADVINRGTASRVRAEGFRLPAAGKTGTTDDFADAWFVGYTPRLVAGVWFGYDEKKKIMKRGFASTVAVPAWARFMIKATAGSKPEWFEQPPDVDRLTVCRTSGMRARSACRLAYSDDGSPNVYTDLFLAGTGPYDTCTDAHISTLPLAGSPVVTNVSAVSGQGPLINAKPF